METEHALPPVSTSAGHDPGLDEAQVEQRRREGAVNLVTEPTSRRVVDIVKANVLTRFNAILGVLLLVILVVGPLQDALFGIVLVANTLIGIVQELRAKRTLDRLALLIAPEARLVRSGAEVDVPVGDIVVGDIVLVRSGDQVVVDGAVVEADHLELDESLLTGESEAVMKDQGDQVLSGSFVTSGSGRYRATHVGSEAYARRLAAEARAFQPVRSELREGIDRILRGVTWLLVPAAALLVSSQLVSHATLDGALRGSVAGLGSMIPEGLVLLTSLAFAAAVVRLARRRVLVQELSAVEVLARVDVVCIDKTGTLTEPELSLREVRLVGQVPGGDVDDALGALASAEPTPNATLRAVAAVCPAPGWRPTGSVPFASVRKWSAVDGGGGAWVLGAPDVIASGSDLAHFADQLGDLTAAGNRVLLLAHADRLDADRLPPGLAPAALVILEERLREDARATVEHFASEGIAVKVISGDHPGTVAAVARRLGLDPGVPVDTRCLDDAELAAAAASGTVFGRVSPHQKRDMVRALQAQGHVVAMTGDGVNDVLALKAADLGVAMASGSGASRAVAPIVLLDSSFSALPSVLAEGRRVIANVEQVANLFVTKTVYAAALALAVGVARWPFPFLPRHLTIISSLTIGVPAFFLALAPNTRRSVPGFASRVLGFALPAGIVAAAATFTAYALARSEAAVTSEQARTVATATLMGVGLWVLGILSRPFTAGRRLLVLTMAATFLGLVAVPTTRSFFDLALPAPALAFAVVGVVTTASMALELGWRTSRWLAYRRGLRHTRPGT